MTDRHDKAFSALAEGRHGDPFSVLGLHRENGERVVRTLQPQAAKVTLLDRTGRKIAPMRRVHEGGIFEAPMARRKRSYRLAVEDGAGRTRIFTSGKSGDGPSSSASSRSIRWRRKKAAR